MNKMALLREYDRLLKLRGLKIDPKTKRVNSSYTVAEKIVFQTFERMEREECNE